MGTISSKYFKGEAKIADKLTPKTPATAEHEHVPKLTPQSQATTEDVSDVSPLQGHEDVTDAPDGAFCWICHEGAKEWPGDQPGFQELNRDCSCRGSSGYSHWSCLVQYAANKVAEGGDITKAWRECPLCNQRYNNELQLDMADAFIQMADQIDDCDPFRYAEALWTKLLAVDLDDEESKKTAFAMISMLEKVDEPHKCAAWAVDPYCHSKNAKNLMSIAYEKLGWQEFQKGVRAKGKSESSKKIQLAIKYYEKYKELAMFVGNMTHVNDAETKIARSKCLDPLNKDETKQDLPRLRAAFEQDPSSLNFSNLVMGLRLEGHQIEIERRTAKEIVKNKRILGPMHPYTMELELGIKGLKVRRVKMLEEGNDDIWAHRLVRYEGEGNRCVITPMTTSHDFPGGNDYQGDGTEFTITMDEFIDKFNLCEGTPVMCIGLKSSKGAQLNGKIGDIRDYNEESQRYAIHFQDKALKPASVKMNNLQVVFDLTSIE